jgi:hypothetical protein
MQDQVVGRKTARKLQEALKSVGGEVETALYWASKSIGISKGQWDLALRENAAHIWNDPNFNTVPAPTLTEMLRVLPVEIPRDGEVYKWGMFHKSISYYSKNKELYIRIDKTHVDPAYFNFNDNLNPATAAAKLAIWLIENGYWEGR